MAPGQAGFLEAERRLPDLSWLARLLRVAKHSIIHSAKWPLRFRLSFPSWGMPDTALPAPVTHPPARPRLQHTAGASKPSSRGSRGATHPSEDAAPLPVGERGSCGLWGEAVVQWTKRIGSGRDFCADFLAGKNVKQPTLVLGGHWAAPTFPPHAPPRTAQEQDGFVSSPRRSSLSSPLILLVPPCRTQKPPCWA